MASVLSDPDRSMSLSDPRVSNAACLWRPQCQRASRHSPSHRRSCRL